jgi:SAM-dependent methyltransferase
MSLTNRYSEYDGLASMYDELGTERHDIVVAQLEKLVLQYLPQEAKILDLCCGTGQIAQRLLKQKYQVTGIDGSEAMLNYARKNAPGADFILDDARFFNLPATFHAAISTDVGLNLILTIEELESAFQNVYQALLNNGIFVFDLYLEELCGDDWKQTTVKGDTKKNHAWISHFGYDSENKLGRDNTTRFELINEQWQRSDLTFIWKLYSASEVKSNSEKVGFSEISMYDIKEDFGVDNVDNIACFVCHKK